MSAAKYHLDHLCAIVDVNGLQIDGSTADVMPSEPLDKKFEAFNWNVLHVDGHDYAAIAAALEQAAACKDKPTVILARTIKGKGVSYIDVYKRQEEATVCMRKIPAKRSSQSR